MIPSLDLFSGIGGISLALKDIAKPLAYVEIDKYCQKVLKERMDEGLLHKGDIFDDIKKFDGTKYKEKCELIYGGFPCQDISAAGLGKGLAGERSGLFSEIIRLTKEVRPSFVFLENVPAIRIRGLYKVVQEFTELRYDRRWTIISAREVGAHHIRKRWFMLAHAIGKGLERQGDRTVSSKEKFTRASCENEDVANTNCSGRKGQELSESKKWDKNTDPLGSSENVANAKCNEVWLQSRRSSGKDGQEASDYMDSSWWFSEPSVDRVVDGLPFRVDRVKALGNAVVPLQTRVAFERLLGVSV